MAQQVLPAEGVAMLLREFPRPTYDTGIGFHWYPDYWHYDLRYLDIFAPHLESMGVTWMSLISDLSRSIPAEFLRRLIERGIEPIIRVDSPGVVYLDQDVLRWRCETYRDSGVHYIQIYNEPNLAYEWPDWSPHGLAERFMDHLIPALETMHGVDGICPVFTPMAGGGNYWDVDLLRQCLEIINRRGLRHLFQKMAVGIHNYAHNRPLTWGKGGQNLWPCSKPHREEPGCENQLGFYMFEWYDQIVRYQVGVSRPLISTESGVIVGNQANAHFPPIDRALHAERSKEMARMIMEGEVPPYLMNGAYWLLFTEDPNKWAAHRWFRDDGHPVLPDSASALRALAKHQRLRFPYLAERLRVLMPDGSVVVMETEEYLKGVVPKEMGTRAHLEALKAQAVAARSYAGYAALHPRHREREADICTTVHCQVWSPQHFAETDQAVKETEGVVATYRDEIINAFYFGHCDGHTRNSEDVWSARVPYCRSVPCLAPYADMYGHGVGMCQRGAMAMAQQGASFGQILTHYYTGVEIFDTFKRREIPVTEPFPVGEPPEVDPWLPLESWPRPEGDNRMGIHAGLDFSDVALQSDRDRILDMGLKWVSLAPRDVAELDRALGILVPAGAMVVARPRAPLGEAFDFAAVVAAMLARGAPPYVQLYRWPTDEFAESHENPPLEVFTDGWIQAATQVYEAG
ncbi:MAG: SpoIID/LytB domain-containing protein, partial [Anaerolineae bacterium]